MDDYHSYIRIFFLIILMLCNISFYAFGSAMESIHSNHLEDDFKDLKNPKNFYIAKNIVTMLFAFALFGMCYDTIAVYQIGIKAIVSIVISISFCIIIPKRLALKFPKQCINTFGGVIRAVLFVCLPLCLLVHGISYPVLKLFGIDWNAMEDDVTEEDIMSMVNEGHEKGVLESSEAEMITNIFELDDKDASDIMTHRKNLIMLDGDESLDKVVDFILNTGINTRYPVYEDNIDNIIGILHLKDALIFSRKGNFKNRSIKNIKGLIRPAHFIPETRSLDTLFEEMQAEKMHMVIVVDEYGQTAGIVTMEDILEEIVGNIMDEYDVEENYIEEKDGAYIVSGQVPLEDLSEKLHIPFTEEEYENFDTLNGFIISKLDRIPVDGEDFCLTYAGYEFTALHVENKMIHSVKIIKQKEEKEDTEEV